MGEQSQHKMIPYIVWEGERARDERRHRRDFIIILVLIAALLVSNAVWVYVTVKRNIETGAVVSVEGDAGVANVIGHDGDINYGESGRK